MLQPRYTSRVSERPVEEWTDAELEDAAEHVNRERYPDQAALLDAEIARRSHLPEHIRVVGQRCGALIGWVRYGYPMASLDVYLDRLFVRTFTNRTVTIPLGSITALRVQRDFVTRYLRVEHSLADQPELGLWVKNFREVAAAISRVSGCSVIDD